MHDGVVRRSTVEYDEKLLHDRDAIESQQSLMIRSGRLCMSCHRSGFHKWGPSTLEGCKLRRDNLGVPIQPQTTNEEWDVAGQKHSLFLGHFCYINTGTLHIAQ